MNSVQVNDGGLKFSEKNAILSHCGTYRYVLTRRVPQVIRWVKPALFIMLNPSIADAEVDDPTIRRCWGFSNSWGCTSLTVVNRFALRSTDPAGLYHHADPYGPENDRHLEEQIAAHRLGVIVCAWGAEPIATASPWFEPFIQKLKEANAQCLGMTKNGSPKHPLYLKKTQDLIPWKGTAE
jgi:hypothetical protein